MAYELWIVIQNSGIPRNSNHSSRQVKAEADQICNLKEKHCIDKFLNFITAKKSPNFSHMN